MKKMIAVFILLAVLLSACGPFIPEPNDFPPRPTDLATLAPVKATDVPTVSLTPLSGGEYPEAVFNARKALASKTGFSVDQITVINFEPVDWPDTCLGVSTPGIMCAMMITPGYRVILRANSSDYEYHTDARDTVILANLRPAINP